MVAFENEDPLKTPLEDLDSLSCTNLIGYTFSSNFSKLKDSKK